MSLAPKPAVATRSGLRTGRDVRLACRAGSIQGSTAGLAPGYVQGNLAILPKDLAGDFLLFCQRNPKPCPLIAMSDVGDPRIPSLGDDLDIRTDLPGYRVWKDGELVEETTDISSWWRGDLVSFILGCSLSFEEALIDEGIAMRHIERGLRVSMYRTSMACTPAGAFAGPMVASMRPLKPHHAIRAVQVTSRFPALHGAPIHIGHPHMLGIRNLALPDYGDAIPVEDDELPVFWACGVTPQAVIAAVRPPFAISHSPGLMLVTDRKNSEFDIL